MRVQAVSDSLRERSRISLSNPKNPVFGHVISQQVLLADPTCMVLAKVLFFQRSGRIRVFKEPSTIRYHRKAEKFFITPFHKLGTCCIHTHDFSAMAHSITWVRVTISHGQVRRHFGRSSDWIGQYAYSKYRYCMLLLKVHWSLKGIFFMSFCVIYIRSFLQYRSTMCLFGYIT